MNNLNDVSGKSEKTADAVEKMASKVSERADELKEQFEKYSENVTEYIKKCPIKSVAIASVAGVVIGFLMKR